jgi:hypothetical protein
MAVQELQKELKAERALLQEFKGKQDDSESMLHRQIELGNS